jgi:hypothetical protein
MIVSAYSAWVVSRGLIVNYIVARGCSQTACMCRTPQLRLKMRYRSREVMTSLGQTAATTSFVEMSQALHRSCWRAYHAWAKPVKTKVGTLFSSHKRLPCCSINCCLAQGLCRGTVRSLGGANKISTNRCSQGHIPVPAELESGMEWQESACFGPGPYTYALRSSMMVVARAEPPGP